MPHIVIEYARHIKDINPKSLLSVAYDAAAESGLFADVYDIKVRAMAYEDYSVGQTNDTFIHITVKLLQGRSDEQKASLTQHILDKVMALNYTVENISVEAVDIHTKAYSKQVQRR